MKKTLIILVLVTLFMVLLASSAFALHTQDPQGRRCISCHSTHMGVTDVLMNPSVATGAGYDIVTVSTTCLACHDGTNSRAVTGGNSSTMWKSGLFNLDMWPTDRDTNYSAHTVDIAAEITRQVVDAPGNKNLDYYDSHKDQLSCASCHNPHGNLGDSKGDLVHAYLKVNPNDSIDGKFLKNEDWAAELDNKEEVSTVILYSAGGGVYANTDSAPWLRTYAQHSGNYAKYPVAVEIGGVWVFSRQSSDPRVANFSVNPLTGEIRFDKTITDPGLAQLNAKVFKPIMVNVVDTFTGTIYDEDDPEEAITLSGVRIYTNNVNRWCGSCHGNFDIRSRTGDTYVVDEQEYHGHNVYRRWNQDYATPYSSDGNANCLSCHYAHGTNSDLMVDSLKQVIGEREFNNRGTITRYIDPMPANKRYFGGSVCMKCHYQSHNYNFMFNNSHLPEDFQWQ